MTGDTDDLTILADVGFDVWAATDDDTGRPCVVLVVRMPDNETTFGAMLTPEAADRLALVLQDAAGITDPCWPAIGLS